ncbi:MAG TPA: alkaline phosphatase family protein [Thermoplasmataceae archaeon]|nr:alkaline phosphatase family protein [Thermoplasmatales archaeon AK]HLH86562.1 alkaline phosphatase family protein [Thermoplasmataceae archaeon]
MTPNYRVCLLVGFVAVIMIVPYVHPDTNANKATETPIKHVVILMMENHSFDNLFGIYPMTSNGSVVANITKPLNLLTAPHLSGLQQVANGSFSTPDPYEGYGQYHTDWNEGKMNGFLNGSGPNSLDYFSANQTGLEWDMAMNYALADNYYSSALTETLPNRLYSIAGFSPVSQDQLYPPPFVAYSETIYGELDRYNVSWSYYFLNPVLGINPLDFIYGINNHLNHIGTWGNFISQVDNGSLPAVSWVSPISGGAFFYSQHPPDNILSGEIWIYYIVNKIMESPLWNSTAIMITYDEGGGYYDQSAPPVVAGQQLGFRVPFILISPYAKEDYISNTVMSHTSILAFIDYNWNLPPLNRLVAYSNIPLDMFDFAERYRNGQIIRPPYNFDNMLNQFLPRDLSDSTSLASGYHSVGYIFPVPFQFNPSTLPYSRTGQSNFNLSNDTSYFVAHDSSFIPWYLNKLFYYPVIAIAAASIIFLSYRIFKRRKLRRNR